MGMNASIALQVLPNVTEREETRRIVDEVIAYIESTGLHYVVGAFETTIEGDLDELLEIVKESQKICVRAGAPGVMSYVKISYEPDGVWTIDDKTGKYEKKRREREEKSR
jgi:uncharacterized protein YqgV (UPF0045/DUF77 family)